MSIVVLMGPPGSGKGTLAQSCKSLGFEVVGVGDLLRHRASFDDELGREIRAILDRGDSVSNNIIEKIIFDRIVNLKQEYKFAWPGEVNFILDGFPRNIAQMTSFYNFLVENYWEKYLLGFCVDIDVEVVRARLSKRFSCTICCNVQKTPGACQNCGALVSRRGDDQSNAAIDRRIELFNNAKSDLVCFFNEKKVKVSEFSVDQEMTEKDVLDGFLAFLDERNKV